jgi:hypothetical protein
MVFVSTSLAQWSRTLVLGTVRVQGFRKLSPGTDPEFGVEAGKTGLNSPRGDEQHLSDLGVGAPVRG